jgi:hypothetical protein
MGSAFTGLADDLNALVWNPAGLACIPVAEVSALHTAYHVDTRYEMIGYAQPFGPLGTFAIGASMLDYGDLPRRPERPDTLPGEPAGSTTANDVFVTLGWGTALPPLLGMNTLKAGANLKFTDQRMSQRALAGVGMSVGALWDPGPAGLRAGTLVENAGEAAGGGAGRSLPLRWVVGGSYAHGLADDVAGTAALDLRVNNDAPFQAALGVEVTGFDLVSVRGGWRTGATGGPTFGIGLRTPASIARGVAFRVDYAIASSGDLGSSQRFELSAQFVGRHVPMVMNFRLTREGGVSVLGWDGRAAAYLVFRKTPESPQYAMMTEHPIPETSLVLTGLPAGRYTFKVVPMDPAKSQWFEDEAQEVELTLEGGDAPVTPAPAETPPEIAPVPPEPSAPAPDTPNP